MRFADALGWTLLNFIWQGTLLAVIFALGRLALTRASSNLRYLLGCATLLGMLAAPIATMAIVARRGGAAHLATAGNQGSGFSSFFPVLNCIWLAGVVILSIWSAGGWVVAQRLRRKCRSGIPVEWEWRMARLCHSVGVSRTVRVFQTALTDVPMVVGWMRPVILVPVCALTNLNVLQLEALLAHELAHIRRHDYLVNLLQTGIETLLYYHPAVWWVGKQIRDERENCCDDVAVAVCASTVVYASALANLEANRVAAARLAMAASNGSLLQRIRRLTSSRPTGASVAPGWLLALAVSFALAAILTASVPRSREIRSLRAAAEVNAPRGSFVAALTAAGYTDISVDDIIALKEHGISSRYLKIIAGSGIGKPAPADLIRLHDNGVEERHIHRARQFGLESMSVDLILQLKESGVLSSGRQK